MSRALFWVGGVSGGGWDIILGERGWVKKYFGGGGGRGGVGGGGGGGGGGGVRGMSGDLCTV